MNEAFAADLAAIMDGPLGVTASYRVSNHGVLGAPVSIRLVPDVGDQAFTGMGKRLAAPVGVFLIPTAAVEAPAAGDTIEIDGLGTFTVQGTPVRDERRLRWRVEARPT